MQPRPTELLSALEVQCQGRVTLYVNPKCPSEADRDELLRLPVILRRLPGHSSRQAGRTTSWLWRPAWDDGPGLMVRQYAHGGALGRLFGAAFLGKARMLKEFWISDYAGSRGVPTSVPVALRVERIAGPFIRAHFVSALIPEAQDLLRFLESAPSDAEPVPGRRRLAAAIADAIARMHDAGIVHADLNLKNVLVRHTSEEPEAFIIDFDKARWMAAVPLSKRMANLVRLDRSIVKWAASRRTVDLTDRLRVLHSYLRRYPQWRDQWARIARKYGGRHLRHSFSREPDSDRAQEE